MNEPATISGVLEQRHLQAGPVGDGPVELWVVVTDDADRPLALSPIELGALRPEAVGGELNLVGSAELSTLTTGNPDRYVGRASRGWLVMVGPGGQYAPVFPLEFGVAQDLWERDRVTLDHWEWTIRKGTT